MTQGHSQLISYGYLFLTAGVIALAVWLPRSMKARIAAGVAAAVLMSIPILYGLQEVREKKEAVVEERKQVNVAQQRFNELCKAAGIKINQTVDAVDSIVLLKVRPTLEFKDTADPMLPGAAMAGERQGDAYIETFLGPELKHPANPPAMRGSITLGGDTDLPGYRSVEAQDPKDGHWYRYTRLKKVVDGIDRTELKREPIAHPTARYAVDYEDIVDANDRKMWIAGTVVRVVDQTSGDVLATYTKFVRDGGMGTTGGSRDPWVHASHSGLQCPMPTSSTDTQTRYFIDQVLVPKKGG